MNRDTFYFVIVFAFFLLLTENGKYPVTDYSERALNGYKEILKTAKETVTQSQYGLGYGNLTGLKLSYEDNLADRNALLWPFRDYTPGQPWKERQEDSLLPDIVSSKVKSFWAQDRVSPGKPAYLLNISGDVYGDFTITKPSTPLKPYLNQLPKFLEEFYEALRNQKYEEEKQRYEDDPENNLPPQEVSDTIEKVGNITTYTEGDVILQIRSLESTLSDVDIDKSELGLHKDAVLVALLVELRNHPRTDSNTFDMFAVYFQDTGSLVGLTKSAKFMGLHALPHFTQNLENFEKSKFLVSKLLNLTNIDRDIAAEDVGRTVDVAQTKCELISYIQLEKTQFDKTQLSFIDDELKNPQGLPLPKRIPRIEVKKSLFYSPDCGILFESSTDKDFVGIRQEVKYSQLRKALFFVFLLAILELRLFMRQTKYSRTPSSLSNISTLSIGLLSGYDLLIAMIMTLVMWLTDLYLICACLAVFNILLFYVFQLRYLLTISATQANERGSTWREILRGSLVRRNSGDRDLEAQTDTTQAAAAAPPATQPVAEAANQGDTIVQSATNPMQYFMISFFISFAVTVIALNAFSWSLWALRFFEYFCLLVFNSYLFPQFLRNTLKNKSQTLSWEFSIGTALVRLIPLYYLCLNPSNPFRHPYDPVLVIVITCWLLAQLVLLFCQKRFGARFWVKSKWLPEQYNYQPTLTLKDLETGFSSDILANLKPEEQQGDFLLCEIDCAICMSALTLPIFVADKPIDKVANPLMSKVLVTPCHHIFHLTCLEDWMIQKLQCPVCRSALPPI